jgi:ferredoxin
MKVWIDQDLCTGDGLCEEICPSVFTLLDDGLAYVKDGDSASSSSRPDQAARACPPDA